MNRPNVPRQCIFCDDAANSKEHFWSSWMHGMLPAVPNPKHDRRFYSFHPSAGHREDGPHAKPGSIHTIKIRAVCKRCNNGWMSQLEEQSRPFLTPMINGTPIVLDEKQVEVVARWITLKCIVAEHATRNSSLTPRHDRESFKENGAIPAYFRIYCANHNMADAAGYMRHTSDLRLTLGPHDPPLFGADCNVQTQSFMLGKIMIHVNAARVANFDLESRYALIPFHEQCRIWPLQRIETVFPHRPLLNQEGMAKIANCLPYLTAHQTKVWTTPIAATE
jgi:hypothetical protein